MKNQVCEAIKKQICNRNNYEESKKLLDAYYYDQCGHIDSFARDRDLERLFPIKVKLVFDEYYVFMNGAIRFTVLRSRHIFRHERYHNMQEVYDEIKKR